MAQLIVHRGPAAATKKKNTLQDWDSFLHGIWREKMADNPSLYDDARVPHNQGTCPCKCTGDLYLREGHRRK